MKLQALNYLNKNKLLNISMIEPIRRGQAEILYADSDAALIRIIPGNILMLSADKPQKGMELLRAVGKPEQIVVHQESMIEPVKKKYGMKYAIICYQAVYTKKELLSLGEDTDIRLLDESFHAILTERYHLMNDPEYMMELIKLGVMHGIFVENQLAGFMGMHTEGSMGLLEIFPEYQRQGLATELQKYMINVILKKGWVPFGQVIVGNQESMGLQEKLGMEFADGKVSWIF